MGSLDFTNFHNYVDCIKAKAVDAFKKNATRSQNLLDLIYTDVCEPFDPCFNDQKYFIVFINDYSTYMCLQLIHETSIVFLMFKDFKLDV